MWGFFKKITKPKCNHYKQAGYPYPENMKQLFRFSDYKEEIDSIGYSVSECTECGTRSFGCIGFHMMANRKASTIDDFIAHKISREDLIKFLKTDMEWFKIYYEATPPTTP